MGAVYGNGSNGRIREGLQRRTHRRIFYEEMWAALRGTGAPVQLVHAYLTRWRLHLRQNLAVRFRECSYRDERCAGLDIRRETGHVVVPLEHRII